MRLSSVLEKWELVDEAAYALGYTELTELAEQLATLGMEMRQAVRIHADLLAASIVFLDDYDAYTESDDCDLPDDRALREAIEKAAT